jgi:hypothetical protein
MTDPQEPDDNVAKGLRYVQERYGEAESRSYGDGGLAEPAPPQTAEDRARDLEHVIQRVREAVGTDVPATATEARVDLLESTLREVLGRFVHETHPGRPCLQTDHVSTATVKRWNAVLNGRI